MNKMSGTYIPRVYREWGGPLRWQDDVTGVLPKAVKAYFAYKTKQGPPLLRAQFKLVIEYAAYYINAPCWDANPYHDEESRARLAQIRQRVQSLTPETEQEFDRWLHECVQIDIDPF